MKNNIFLFGALIIVFGLLTFLVFWGGEKSNNENRDSGLQSLGVGTVESLGGAALPFDGNIYPESRTSGERSATTRYYDELTTPPPEHRMERIACVSEPGQEMYHGRCCGEWASSEIVTLVGSMSDGEGAICIYHF